VDQRVFKLLFQDHVLRALKGAVNPYGKRPESPPKWLAEVPELYTAAVKHALYEGCCEQLAEPQKLKDNVPLLATSVQKPSHAYLVLKLVQSQQSLAIARSPALLLPAGATPSHWLVSECGELLVRGVLLPDW
jgi:hypothetical protein